MTVLNSPVGLDEPSESVLQLKEAIVRARTAKKRLSDTPASHDLGLSLLKCKHQVLSTYILNVLFAIFLNATGNHDAKLKEEVAKALFKTRTMLEKSKPIESRMRHYIERLLELDQQKSKDSLLLTHKPNLSSILEEDENERGSGHSEDDDAYKAPQIAPAFFHSSQAELDQKKKETQRLSAKKQRLVKELNEQFSTQPEEVSISAYAYSDDEDLRREHDLTRFEEENFTRIETKKKKRTPKLIDALSELDSLGLLDKYTPDSGDEKDMFRSGSRKKLRKLSKRDLDEEIPSDDDFSESTKTRKGKHK